jgi:hypothetical protein
MKDPFEILAKAHEEAQAEVRRSVWRSRLQLAALAVIVIALLKMVGAFGFLWLVALFFLLLIASQD